METTPLAPLIPAPFSPDTLVLINQIIDLMVLSFNCNAKQLNFSGSKEIQLSFLACMVRDEESLGKVESVLNILKVG